ncbi:smoothelin-like protein 1 [Anolis carolinensis]|uniref:smoothelin-like protein 1 n=1 Tax=Anolis carolinensis TaxID=28377 RepID=UPI002F2B4846
MEGEGTKEQQEMQQINGVEQKGESGDAQIISKGESKAGKTEGVGNEESGENKTGKAQPTGKEAVLENETGKDDAGKSETEKTEDTGKEDAGENQADKGENSGKEDKQVNEIPKKALGNEERQGSETIKEVKESHQAQAEATVALGESGTEPKEEADVSGTAEEPQEGKGEKDGAVEKNASISKKESRTGSTSDEPLSPGPEEEEEEYWPEFSPSSPDESPQSPTELKSMETGSTTSGPSTPEAATGDITSTEAAPEGTQEQQQQTSPEPTAASKEKKKRPALDRREITRPRMPPRVQSRKAIMDKFGGAATGPAPNIKKTGGANTIKTMLLEWCRAKTRGYEHVDIQNFSSSWSSAMAFCALIHSYFPDAFDYSTLDPANRRENFTLAFSTAEKLADCAQLLEVDDMVRMSVPDNKCIYTYIQELYRSLVQKGLVKTKKK